jgi:hypothetical protein
MDKDFQVRYYPHFAQLGVGIPGQRLLDLGTGLFANEFARAGVL